MHYGISMPAECKTWTDQTSLDYYIYSSSIPLPLPSPFTAAMMPLPSPFTAAMMR